MGVGKRSSKRPLQEVLGRGANVNKDNPLEVHDPKVGSLISYEGVTTADGAADGSSLIDSVLTTKPDYDGNLVVITSGAYAGQARDIDGTTTGTVNPTTPFGGQILSGTTFVILALRLTPAEVAAIEAKLDHAGHGLAALKALIDAVEGKLDVPANFMADVSALALEATLGTHDTDIKALLATVQADLDNPDQYKAAVAALALEATLTAIKGAGWTDETLVALKAAIDAIPTTAERGTDNALLAADYTAPDNAGIGTLLTRITAAVALASALTTHDTDIKALLATIAAYIDTEVAAILAAVDTEVAAILEDTGTTIPGTITTLQAAVTAIKAKTDNLKDSWNDITAAAVKTAIEAAGSHLALIKAQTDKIADKMLFTMDFWSVPQISVVVPAGAANQALPDVVVAGLPGTMTVVKATAMFKFRMLDNAGAANKLSGAQHIQIQKGGAGGYADAISLVDDQFGIAEATREGGDIVVGDHNVVAKVDGDATYNFQWTSALADIAGLTFNDVQMGIKIWYKV